jgi:hypothetical protein
VLAERGDTGETPRHTLFFLYGGNVDGLRNSAAAAGYSVSSTAENDGVILEITTAVDEQSFAMHAQRMRAWADEFGCDYDGWECQVVSQ